MPTRERRQHPDAAPLAPDIRRLLYPVAEVARLLGCDKSTLYRRCRQGRIRLVRDGGKTFVTATELERYLAEELRQPEDRGRAS